MSALLFPTADALRLALASGVVPAGVARGPVAAGRGDGGGLWLTPSVPLPADLLDRPDSLCLLPHPPAHLLDRPDVSAYHPAADGVWVRVRWQHPLPAAVAVPAGSVAFVDPPADWHLHPTPQFLDPADVFPLTIR